MSLLFGLFDFRAMSLNGQYLTKPDLRRGRRSDVVEVAECGRRAVGGDSDEEVCKGKLDYRRYSEVVGRRRVRVTKYPFL
jgi:hypothetical protein